METSTDFERHSAIASTVPKTLRDRLAHAESVQWLIEHEHVSEWPRQAPAKPDPEYVAPGNPTPAAIVAEREKRIVRPHLITESLDDIQEEHEEWLWPGRIPRGTPTVIMGRQGDGKSTFLSWLAANVTTGRPWPDCPDDNEPGSVLILQAEESAARAIKPRMTSFGYARGKVRVIKGVDRGDGEESWFSLAHDCLTLEDECEKIGDVRLIIVDPLGSYIRGISGYNENEVRGYMQPLFKVAADYDLAVVLALHPNKDSEKDILDRASGSGAITQMARMAWYLSEDPTDRDRRLFSLMKGNLHESVETAIALHYDKKRRVMTWFTEPIKLRARQVDHLLQKANREAKFNARPGGLDPVLIVKAQDLILEMLRKGPLMQSSAQDQALNAGIKEGTFRKALKRFLVDDGRVKRERRGDDGRWWLVLSAPPEEAPEHRPPGEESAPGE